MELYTHIIQVIFVFVALIGYYVTFVHFKWWNIYRPSPLIKHLLFASAAVDLSATAIAVLAILGLLKVTLPPGVGLTVLSLALLITLSVKIFRRFDLRALDTPTVELVETPRAETQNQREDRQFGEERRKLEVVHMNGDETANQRADREIGDAKRKSEDEIQDAINDANKE